MLIASPGTPVFSHGLTGTSMLACSQLGMVGMDDLWPSQQDAPGFQPTAEAFMAHCHRVSRQLLGSFATGLGLEPEFFNKVSSSSKLGCANSSAYQ